MQVSIIIVNYNTRELLRNCLKSVYEQTKDIEFEVIVSDNGSTDGSVEMIRADFPQVVLIENGVNLGFGAANNRGLAVAKGKYIFYLNSDTLLLNNAVKCFFDYWENAEDKDSLGALGGNLVDNDCAVAHSFGSFPDYKTEVSRRFKNAFKLLVKRLLFALGKSYEKKSPPAEIEYLGEVGYVTGADLFVRNDVYARFDERFFLYYEESDMQLNMMRHGLRRLIIDGPKIQHLCLALNKPKNDIELQRSFSHIQSDKSAIIYFRKNLCPGKDKKCIMLRLAVKLCWIFAGVSEKE